MARMQMGRLLAMQGLTIVIPDGSLLRADPGPKYPGIRNKGEAGILGSRLSRLAALVRDDTRKAVQRRSQMRFLFPFVGGSGLEAAIPIGIVDVDGVDFDAVLLRIAHDLG